jgi:hypothetical protein
MEFLDLITVMNHVVTKYPRVHRHKQILSLSLLSNINLQISKITPKKLTPHFGITLPLNELSIFIEISMMLAERDGETIYPIYHDEEDPDRVILIKSIYDSILGDNRPLDVIIKEYKLTKNIHCTLASLNLSTK